MNFETFYREMAQRFLERDLTLEEGCSEAELRAAEARLGFALPLALHEFYRVAGRSSELNEHNPLYALGELEVKDDYLPFMVENQAVVFWAVRADACNQADPLVWQATNEELLEWFSDGWFSEELPVSRFLFEMFRWQFEATPDD